jgi:hypothetical protein
LNNLGTSSVDWLVRFWANSKDFFDVRDKLIYAIKTNLDQAKITIPFPQLDVHWHDAAGKTLQTTGPLHPTMSLNVANPEPEQPKVVSMPEAQSPATIPFTSHKLRPRMRNDQKSDAA